MSESEKTLSPTTDQARYIMTQIRDAFVWLHALNRSDKLRKSGKNDINHQESAALIQQSFDRVNLIVDEYLDNDGESSFSEIATKVGIALATDYIDEIT